MKTGDAASESSFVRRFFLLCVLCAPVVNAADWRFSTDRDGEVGLTMHASAPGTNWGKPGAEAVILTMAVDGRYNQDVTLYLGSTPHDYKVLLGHLRRGQHTLSYRRNARYSAKGAQTFDASFQAQVLDDPALAHAPVLYIRPNTVGKFSDLPLLAWYEWLDEPGGRVLQFSTIFSNEDGGTDTLALLARWGRTLDIEHLYRWTPSSEIFQASNHKETTFHGRKIGQHPILYDVTDNNNFEARRQGRAPLRVILWPVPADLSKHSRELLADENPWLYRVMAEEMSRENKLGLTGDLRGYLYVEAKVTAAFAAISFSTGSAAGDRGDPKNRIDRDGWIRTAIQVPDKKFAGLTVRCFPPRKPKAQPPVCGVDAVTKAFFLDENYRPGPNLFQWQGPAVRLAPGESRELK